MIDLRLYRIAFLPALAMAVVLAFSLEPLPDPLEPLASPSTFDTQRAVATTRGVLATAHERPPGSSGDAASADLVAQRFELVDAGQVSEQRFESSFDGEDVALRNVILTLPGESDSTIVVMAARDSARGPGAASSAAATGVLTELATELGATEHRKTIVLVSTDGGSDGAIGAREFAANYPNRSAIEAVVVIAQPGASERVQPYLVRTSTGEQSASIQLMRTVERAIAAQTDDPPALGGWFGELSRLAIPSGLGEQAPLIEDGLDAIAISSAGERPLEPSRDEPADLSGPVIGEFGRAALASVLALDASTSALVHGPDAYVRASGNLVPGWALAIFGLSLILPAAIAALDGLLHAGRRGIAGRGLGWAITRALPPLAALLLLYLMALIGIVPSPRSPFDPGRFPTGVGQILLLGVLGAVCVAGWAVIGGLRSPRALPRPGMVVGVGAAATGSVLVLWLANPYLGLLLAPAAHPWVLLVRSDPPRRPAPVVVALGAALIPGAAALLSVSGALDLGIDTPWYAVLSLANGGYGLTRALATCLLAGSIVGAIALARGPRPIRSDTAEPPESESGGDDRASESEGASEPETGLTGAEMDAAGAPEGRSSASEGGREPAETG